MTKRHKANRQVHIHGTAPHGWGVSGKGRDRVFVWGGLIGDDLLVGSFRQERGRVEASIESVIQRLIPTVEPECPHFDICGGCLWQSVPYATQLLMKREIVTSCFASARLDTGCVMPVVASDLPFSYRNKNDFTFGFGPEPALGFFESEIKISAGRNRGERGRVPPIFEVTSCALQTALADSILGTARAALKDSGLSYYHPGTRRGILRSLVIRQSAASGDILVHFVASKDCGPALMGTAKELMLAEPKVKGVVLSVNNKRSKNSEPQSQTILAGQGWITEQILGLEIRVSPTTFVQVNTHQAENLYRIALAFAGVSVASEVLDLYSGSGGLSLHLARQAKRVVGIEVVEASVYDAQNNALRNQIENCQFICGDVADILPDSGIRPDVVTVNPPRGGVAAPVIEEICKARPDRIVYISCNPQTLARDLVHFIRLGYRIEEVQPVDMFPQTPHIEVVVRLERRSV
jgi:23S rRNA (uracil1939-C5)-methyltransferase